MVSDAKVVEIQDSSSTVKTLKLKVKSEEFSFFAGQWLVKKNICFTLCGHKLA